MLTELSINGRQYKVELSNLPADITLNTFIREHAGLTGTKFMCQEGGCGVCVCAVTGKDPLTGDYRTWAVNSCLTLLSTCGGLEITTVEGLGNKRDGYHPIQRRLAKLNGTQCGYCSPGFVMNMYALLAGAEEPLTMAAIENAFGGNICRCTGYRPILDAMKSFAVDSNIELPLECRDIEDLIGKQCPKSGDACNGSCKAVSNLKHSDGRHWYWPRTVVQVLEILLKLNDSHYTLVAGNTGHGVYRRATHIEAFIAVNGVPELRGHKLTQHTLTLGANNTLTECMSIFRTAANQAGFEYCAQLRQHFDWIANVPVRNTGTLAGNLLLKHEHPEFPSDVYIVFEALGARVVIAEHGKRDAVKTLDEYLKTSMRGKLLKCFILAAYPKQRYLFDSYKVMPRAQNAHAYVNAAFLLHMAHASGEVLSASICFGGIAPNYTHATVIEQQLIGHKLFDEAKLAKIFSSLSYAVQPDHVLPDATPAYRHKLACALLYKFLLKHAPVGSVAPSHISGGSLLQRDVSSGKQRYETLKHAQPVHQPIEKLEALIQVSGEANYCNDLPTQQNQLWAAFVCGKRIGASVSGIDTRPALELPGVVAYFDAKDLPGPNTLNPKVKEHMFFTETEELFATGAIKYFNQPIGVLVATSNELAHRAAELVQLSYAGGEDYKIMPTLRAVLESDDSARIMHEIISPITQLEVKCGYDLSGSGELDLGLQYHYFLEPFTALALPMEGGLHVYLATQWLDLAQDIISKALNLKTNEVYVKTRRVGGSYGGKSTRCNMLGCAAALAAYKLNRPVRFAQSLESIMHSMGKRWALHADYEWYAKRDGRVISVANKFYEDAGYLPNESPMGHTELVSKNFYQFTAHDYKLDGYMVFTDTPSNTSCRGPGSVEAIAMLENIMEHVAFVLRKDPIDVRLANIVPGDKMASMLPYFEQGTDYRERRKQTASFNQAHRWRKRGLGLSLMSYHVGYFSQYPATVAIYHSDGTVVVTHGGIEMGQGMNTKIAQVVAYTLGIPLDLVKIEASDTIHGANTIFTGGSAGSEAFCYAARNCCNTLNQRLAELRKQLGAPSWEELINAAYDHDINLIASDHFKQSEMEPYRICGLALSEIELDVLTGNYLVSRVDILEDAGESLNPSVDIGQVEGAFMMGLGYWTSEQFSFDQNTGECLTTRTWHYKPPGAKDIPIDFRIELLPNSPYPKGFMRSKATGEPALCLAVSVGFALQDALQAARDHAALSRQWIPLRAPMTPEYLVLNAGTEIEMLKLS